MTPQLWLIVATNVTFALLVLCPLGLAVCIWRERRRGR